MSENRPQYRGVSVVGPVLLIGLGIVLLLQQSGYLNWSLWEIAGRLWPVVIIAVGADILIGRRSFWGGIVALVVVLVLLVGGLMLMDNHPAAIPDTTLEGESYSAPMPDSKSAEITLSPDAGELRVRALAGSSGDLMHAVFQEPSPGNVTKSSEIVDGTMRIVLDDKNFESLVWNFGQKDVVWDAALSPEIPILLHLMLGAGEINADLTSLKIESVDAKLGAGEIVLTLPSTGDVQVNVSLGVGSVDIKLPAGAGVSIHCTTAIGNCDLPNGSGFWSQDYTSPNYDSAENTVRIQVSLAIGEVKVR